MPLLCRAYRSAPLQTNRHTPLPLFYLCADIQNISCCVMRLISSSEGKNHMHAALSQHIGIRCLATVGLFAALAATQAQAGNVGVSIGIYVPGVPVYVAPPPPPPPRALRHMPPPYVVYAPPHADSMDHLLATIFLPDTTSTHPNAAVTCITGRHPIVAKSDGQGLQEPHNRGSWCLIEECLPWLKPYSSSTALI